MRQSSFGWRKRFNLLEYWNPRQALDPVSTGRPWRKAAVVDTAHHVPKVHGRAAGIRNWRRHYGRAQEVEVSLPDGVLLLKSLDTPLQHLGALDPQTAFRLSQSRMQLELDQHPTHHNLWVFSQCLLAEAETLCLTLTTSTSSTTPIKLKQLDGDLSEVSSQDQQRGPQVKIQSTGAQAELLLCVGQGVHSWKKLQMALCQTRQSGVGSVAARSIERMIAA